MAAGSLQKKKLLAKVRAKRGGKVKIDSKNIISGRKSK